MTTSRLAKKRLAEDLEVDELTDDGDARPAQGHSSRRRLCRARWLVILCVVVVLSVATVHASRMLRRRERIIVVGAGLAGLAAARALQDCCDVVVLEARDRLGGRVWTDHSLRVPVELGAVWIHRSTHNVITELADAHGCGRVPSENKRLALYGLGGERLSEQLVSRTYADLTKRIMPEFLRRRDSLRRAGRDQSMASVMGSVVASLMGSGGVQATHGAWRCALDFLFFRDIVQDHTAELSQASTLPCTLPCSLPCSLPCIYHAPCTYHLPSATAEVRR